MKIIEDTKVAENDQCYFYTNSFTQGAEDWAGKYGLEGITCYKAVQKSDPDDMDYVLVRNGEFIYDTKGYDTLGCHIDFMALNEGKTLQ